MKCKKCGVTGFKRIELNDYYGDGDLWCGECCDDQDLIDKNEDWESDEDQTSHEEEDIDNSEKE